MAHFTELKLGAKPDPGDERSNQKRKQHYRLWAGTVIIAIVSGALLLAANGCSEEKPKTAIKQPTPLPVQEPVATTPAAAPVPTQAQSKPHKKTTKKRASTVTYSDPSYGVSFRYPKNYVLKTGDEPHLDLAGLGPVRMNFIQPGGTTLVALEMPRDSYRGAEVSSAFFSVNVNSNLTQDECSLFASAETVDGEGGPVPAARVKVGNIEYDEVEDTLLQADSKYYHVYQQGLCYEFGLGMGTGEEGAIERVPDSTYNQVFDRLEKILASVKFQPGVTPEVASRTPSQAIDTN